MTENYFVVCGLLQAYSTYTYTYTAQYMWKPCREWSTWLLDGKPQIIVILNLFNQNSCVLSSSSFLDVSLSSLHFWHSKHLSKQVIINSKIIKNSLNTKLSVLGSYTYRQQHRDWGCCIYTFFNMCVFVHATKIKENLKRIRWLNWREGMDKIYNL